MLAHLMLEPLIGKFEFEFSVGVGVEIPDIAINPQSSNAFELSRKHNTVTFGT